MRLRRCHPVRILPQASRQLAKKLSLRFRSYLSRLHCHFSHPCSGARRNSKSTAQLDNRAPSGQPTMERCNPWSIAQTQWNNKRACETQQAQKPRIGWGARSPQSWRRRPLTAFETESPRPGSTSRISGPLCTNSGRRRQQQRRVQT